MDYPLFIHFNGHEYKLVGEYYRAYRWGKPGAQNLHRAIWEFHNGPIPEGCHIHHRDGNTLNNSPGNLECLTEHEHRSLHAKGGNSWTGSEAHMRHMVEIGKKAQEWHDSEAGHAWHVEHGKRTWKEKPLHARVCVQCGTAFTSPWPRAKLCSRKCIAAKRRDSGVDNEERVCVTCGNTFTVNKYEKVKNCGKACADVAQALTKRRKAAGL